MTEVSRRGFVVQATMVGAAGAVAAAAGMASAPLMAPALRRPEVLPESLVLHVRDLEAAEVAILVGSEEIVYRDSALVASLLDAFARKSGG